MRTRQRGAALIELALILPLLLLMTFITTEFGRAMYQYNTITKSVRDAVRFLTVQTPGTGAPEAENLIVYGSTANTGTPLVLGLTAANVAAPVWETVITGSPGAPGPLINIVTVTVTGYCFQPLFTSAFGVSFGTAACGNGVGIPYGDITATMRTQL
ncbi:MAG TPA: TadE/TadG family type IV pilus assembly protein [Noviherbaspirillum sp.]|jgi:hypothetical protein|uniref:TadE/TadG family type IV pilus assembly protein n=1 Tax=Noviherbaspirillum sp. TaxID=1926288 RepID=UPI002DDD4FA2|nr:TadE/TadG family type IV pilus assembly protein [Noviherbaspirillum sp.]HEV2610994.1 TadE/TadG family type IV pilus assembly protein [Noviherbaspirillum sp.]